MDRLFSVAMAGEGASPLIKRFATTDPDTARSEVQNCHPWIRGYEPLGRATASSIPACRFVSAASP